MDMHKVGSQYQGGWSRIVATFTDSASTWLYMLCIIKNFLIVKLQIELPKLIRKPIIGSEWKLKHYNVSSQSSLARMK